MKSSDPISEPPTQPAPAGSGPAPEPSLQSRRAPAAIAALGVIAALLVFMSIGIAVSGQSRPSANAARARDAIKKLQNLRADEERILSSYDLSRTPVHIPIDRAMALIVEEANRPHPAGAPSK